MRRATLLGGPRDGEIVDVEGPVLYEPVLHLAEYVPMACEPPPPSRWCEQRAYELRLTADGQYVYVLRRVG